MVFEDVRDAFQISFEFSKYVIEPDPPELVSSLSLTTLACTLFSTVELDGIAFLFLRSAVLNIW
jgi:hypothetical protein